MDYDELEPMGDIEIDKYLGKANVATSRLGAALEGAKETQRAVAYALLLKKREYWIATTVELSIVDRAIREFDKGNYSHPAIYRYLSDKADEIF